MSESGNKDILAGGRRVALVVGVAGLAICAWSALTDTATFFQAYLLAFAYVAAVTLGSLSILLIQHTVTGRWGLAIRRHLEAATRLLPLIAVLFIPVVLGLHHLYGWADPAVVAGSAVLQRKVAYLNVPGFIGRAVLYFAVWLTLAYILNRWSRRQDTITDVNLPIRFRQLAAPGLVAYALTVTFASFDWLMSLEPEWYSTMFGVQFFAGGALAAMSVTILVLSRTAKQGPLAAILKPETIGDLGNLTLAFTLFWTYVTFSQFLIIWSGNLPEEVPWYWDRVNGGWQYVGISLGLLQFIVPFLCLLPRSNRRDLRRLARLAAFILVMRFADLLWIVGPTFSPGLFRFPLVNVGAMAMLGGLWFWLYAGQLGRLPLLPLKDARLTAKEDSRHG